MKLRFPSRIVTAMTLAVAVAAAGCATRVMRPADSADLAPPPHDSPEAALRRFEWSYNHRSLDGLEDLFTSHFRFYFNPRDSAGSDWRVVAWTREEELASTSHLFVGGSAEAPASSITLLFDRTLLVVPDPRTAAWDPTGRWHRSIATQVLLNIRTVDGNAMDISGQAVFYVVRGDSAAVPTTAGLHGAAGDSTTWYIQRWDDETVQDGGGALTLREGRVAARESPRPQRAQPAGAKTWGSIKVIYLGDPGAASTP